MPERIANPQTVRLVAATDLRLEQGNISVGERFEIDDSQAAPLFFDGDATLFGAQTNPPTSLVRAQRAQMIAIGGFGPRCLNTKTISLIEEHVLAGGRKRSTAAGNVLNWIRGGARMREVAAEEIDKQSRGFRDHILQFEACWKAVPNRSSERTSPTKQDEVGLREKGWARSSRRPSKHEWHDGWVEEQHYYWDVGHDWSEYREELDQLQSTFAQILLEAFKDGRVLMFRSDQGLWTLTPPWDWRDEKVLRQIPTKAHYLLSSDLPSHWFPSRAQLRGHERAQAVDEVRRDIEQRYLAQAPDHHLIRKKLIIELLAEEYGYQDSIIKSAWASAKVPAWKEKGNRKRTKSSSPPKSNQKS